MAVKGLLGLCLVSGAVSHSFSADAEIKMVSNDGSDKFLILDKDRKIAASFDSDGNSRFSGTVTVAGSQFSVGGSTLVVAGGKVGIGVTAPASLLEVNGAVRVGNYTTAARPLATSSNKGAFIFDTDIGKPYVSNGLVWKALDSEIEEVKLNSNDGSTKLIVQDKDAGTVFGVDSTGNAVIAGTAAVAGSEFSVGGSLLAVKDGKVGIGTTAPAVALDVNGAVRVGNYTAAARPLATAANKGAFIFDTTAGKPYVSNGTVWKPLDTDFDSDGITDAIDVNDNNAADATAVAADALAGKTFYAGGAAKTGNVPTGANVTGGNGLITFTIPDGLYSGSKTATAVDANLAAENIKSGVTIFGAAGIFTAGATAAAGDILSGKTAGVSGSLITGNVPAGANVSGGNGLTTFTIPNGLYSGSKTATAVDANLAVGNIKSGTTIFGAAGTYTATGHYLPDTEQSVSYASIFDDDADYAPALSQPSYTDNGNGTITDNRTGLIWLKDPEATVVNSTYTWTNAIAACETLSYVYNDWRLPNIRELESIVDYGTAASAKINATYFPNTQGDYYLSSTTYTPNTASVWFVLFSNGYVSFFSKGGAGRVRCVRAGP